MKSVKEIKEMFEHWQREDVPTDDMIVTMAEALIDIIEHLETRAQFVPGVLVQSDDVIERAAMIKALKWADALTTTAGVEYGAIQEAIARLENGGDL